MESSAAVKELLHALSEDPRVVPSKEENGTLMFYFADADVLNDHAHLFGNPDVVSLSHASTSLLFVPHKYKVDMYQRLDKKSDSLPRLLLFAFRTTGKWKIPTTETGSLSSLVQRNQQLTASLSSAPNDPSKAQPPLCPHQRGRDFIALLPHISSSLFRARTGLVDVFMRESDYLFSTVQVIERRSDSGNGEGTKSQTLSTSSSMTSGSQSRTECRIIHVYVQVLRNQDIFHNLMKHKIKALSGDIMALNLPVVLSKETNEGIPFYLRGRDGSGCLEDVMNKHTARSLLLILALSGISSIESLQVMSPFVTSFKTQTPSFLDQLPLWIDTVLSKLVAVQQRPPSIASLVQAIRDGGDAGLNEIFTSLVFQ